MRAKQVSHEDMGVAMGEMKEAAGQLLMSMSNLAKQVDWKSAAPKIAVGLLLLYGVRKHSMIRNLVTSIAVGKVGEQIMSRFNKSDAAA